MWRVLHIPASSSFTKALNNAHIQTHRAPLCLILLSQVLNQTCRVQLCSDQCNQTAPVHKTNWIWWIPYITPLCARANVRLSRAHRKLSKAARTYQRNVPFALSSRVRVHITLVLIRQRDCGGIRSAALSCGQGDGELTRARPSAPSVSRQHLNLFFPRHGF